MTSIERKKAVNHLWAGYLDVRNVLIEYVENLKSTSEKVQPTLNLKMRIGRIDSKMSRLFTEFIEFIDDVDDPDFTDDFDEGR